MPISAGRLTTLISIEEQGNVTDELGQPIDTWVEVCKVWSDIRHLNGTEAIKSGAVTSVVSASIRIRYRTDLNAGMRVLAGAVVYQIKAVLPEMGRREYVDLIAELVA